MHPKPPPRSWKRLLILPGTAPGENRLVAHDSNDPYWTQRIGKACDHTYEPELWFVLDKFADKRTLFIDGGANIGVWSIAAAARIGIPSQVIAVDPSSATMDMLHQNAALNSHEFTIVPKALTAQSGLTLPFNEYDDNTINSLCEMSQRRVPDVKHVTSVTVDDLVANSMQDKPDVTKIIVKLDIEKSELAAIQGMRDTLKNRNTLVVYEDHRVADPNSELSAEVLKMGLHVYYVNDTNQVRRIHSHDEVTAIKVPPRKGYNFLACMPQSTFDTQLERLSRATAKATTAHRQ